MVGKGTKNYRIAETRTRRTERETFDDTDVMQRASQIVMYVRPRTPPLYHLISLSSHNSFHQTKLAVTKQAILIYLFCGYVEFKRNMLGVYSFFLVFNVCHAYDHSKFKHISTVD